AGAGDVDGLQLTVFFPEQKIGAVQSVHTTWRYLLEHSDADTARRLRLDPAYRPDSRRLTFQLNPEGTSGFTLTIDQILEQRNFWIPELDMFVSAGNPPLAFADCRASLDTWQGQRTLAELQRAPEATYEQFANRWADMGNPAYHNLHSIGPGHIVGLTWDSAVAKFGVDRGANVWNDLGNPDHFHLGFDFGAPEALTNCWRGQRLVEGLPIVLTQFEQGGVRYEVEQFAYPLDGPPRERRGDMPMVLLEKVHLTNPGGKARRVTLRLEHRRETADTNCSLELESRSRAWWCREIRPGHAWLLMQGDGIVLETNSIHAGRWTTNLITLNVDLAAGGSRELVVKLPSAPVPAGQLDELLSLDFAAARKQTKRFWSDYLARGAQFSVPEESVNTLFRANLWHALRLPRRHGGAEPGARLDLPYSNFAYGQEGTPWPVNQAIYVDYMLHDLRGYHEISREELSAIYRNNQEASGHVGGFASWGVYTPGMIYAAAQHYLLSGDRKSFEALLPSTLRALDWCLSEARTAAERPGEARGLVLAPLNDLSHEPRAWAFNQAYFYAGIDLLGQALAEFGHPRARECQIASRAISDAIKTGFGHASMMSPPVQLRDHTWIPYVPADALTPGRRVDIWYPTDVDCGALHLSRLKALEPTEKLTSFLLLDHEDNLFLNQWGMANEPVYNPQATAYLRRDEPKAAIRAFYSMMACAFSHSVFEPVEHRWGWGQYFGPPSTDGAWFDLYRHMLVREMERDSLLLCQAAPRKWFEHGKRIVVQRAPTYFGTIDFTVESRTAKGEIRATIKPPRRKPLSAIFLRLRHPEEKPLSSVTVNGGRWRDFDPQKEWVRIPQPAATIYTIVARYDR
ncbi:MAG TPA: hypothetical protein VJA21_12705, partial [Verrucomicrobiae bacterium]